MSIKEKQAEIKEWFNTACDPNRQDHRQALIRAARMLYNKQTAHEQNTESTIEHNKVGFNGRDARFGSWLANQPDISVKAAFAARKMLKKYSRQIARMKLGLI